MPRVYKKLVTVSLGLLFLFPFVIFPFFIGCGGSAENPVQLELEPAATVSEQIAPSQSETTSEETANPNSPLFYASEGKSNDSLTILGEESPKGEETEREDTGEDGHEKRLQSRFSVVDAVPVERETEQSPFMKPVTLEPVLLEPIGIEGSNIEETNSEELGVEEPIELTPADTEKSDTDKPAMREPAAEMSVDRPGEAVPAEDSAELSLPVETPAVEQKSPVDETSPVDESSPVDETRTIQGDLALFFARLIPLTVLVLQDEEAEMNTQRDRRDAQGEEEQPSTAPQTGQPQANQLLASQLPVDEQSQVGGQNRGRPSGQQNFGGRGRAGIAPSPVVREPRLTPAEMLRFNFRNTAWKEVIEWFANQAALNLQADKMPTGSVNLADIKPYTPTEALDVINGYLLLKDYVLVRKVNTLFVLYLPDGIPPNLLDPIVPDDLDQKGKYEICKCVFSLNRTTPDIIQSEIEMFLGPQGSILTMPRSQQIVITETAGVLRAVREIIQRIDDPDGVTTGSIHVVEIKNLTAEEAAEMMRKLLTIEETDTTLRTVVDSTGKKVLLSGRGDMIEKARDVLQSIDASFGSGDPEMSGQPEFRTYPSGSADPNTVYAVLQTLLAGMPETRLSRDPMTGGILVYGRPAVHAKVDDAIKEMQFNAPQVVAIPLNRMSPSKAVETIKLFYPTYSPATAAPAAGGGRGGNQRNVAADQITQAPSVEADTTARQIIVRGTAVQIAGIRDLLKQLGEDGTATAANVSTVRSVPLSPAVAALVLEQLKDVLPSFDSSIKVNVPEWNQDNIPTGKKSNDEKNNSDEFRMERLHPEEYQNIPDIDGLIDETFDTDLPITHRMMKEADGPILAQMTGSQTTPSAAVPSEVNVMLTPAGLVLSSTDPEALTKLEGVIRMLSDESVLQRTSLEIYYLTHSTASVVSPALQSLMGTNTSMGASGVSSVDMSAWDQTGMMGTMTLPQANAIEKTGDVSISVDERLNALYVQANVIDHKTIKKLIDMLDQPNRDNIMKNASPRLLPLVNMRPEDAKTLVETAFSSRMQGSRAGQQGGMQQIGRAAQRGNQRGGQMVVMQGPGGEPMPPGMQQMLQAMGQGRGNANTAREQDPGMTVGVYPQGRALIITSSESLYLEVKAFVEMIDADSAKKVTTVATEKLVHTTPALVGQSLINMLGSDAVTISTNRTAQGQAASGNYGGMGNIGTFGGNRGGTMGVGAFGGGAMGAGTFGGGNRGGMGGRTMGAGTFGGNRGGTMGVGTFGGGAMRAGTLGGGNRGGATRGGTFGGNRGGR